MAIPITVPRLGWNMEQGVFVGWLKADGAAVRAGEPLFTLESEKATEDVEGFDDLDAPIRRLNGAHTPTPYSPPLENAVVPGVDAIAQAVRDLVAE